MNLIDPSYELIDPNPDLHSTFIQFNDSFFFGALAGCEISWSNRMTQCAGLCSFQPRSGYCSIRLSVPLLKLRPRKDFIETLLHEMIHAYLFLTSGNRDRDGHGPEFQNHMHRINNVAGTRITIYHSFHAEVALYKQHWWRCEGRCQQNAPFYGWVKRSMNREPSKNDTWWNQHEQSCGGKFIKVKEPDAKPNTSSKKRKLENTPKIDSIFPGVGHRLGDGSEEHAVEKDKKEKIKKPKAAATTSSTPKPKFPGTGYRLGGIKEGKKENNAKKPKATSSAPKSSILGNENRVGDRNPEIIVIDD